MDLSEFYHAVRWALDGNWRPNEDGSLHIEHSDPAPTVRDHALSSNQCCVCSLFSFPLPRFFLSVSFSFLFFLRSSFRFRVPFIFVPAVAACRTIPICTWSWSTSRVVRCFLIWERSVGLGTYRFLVSSASVVSICSWPSSTSLSNRRFRLFFFRVLVSCPWLVGSCLRQWLWNVFLFVWFNETYLKTYVFYPKPSLVVKECFNGKIDKELEIPFIFKDRLKANFNLIEFSSIEMEPLSMSTWKKNSIPTYPTSSSQIYLGSHYIQPKSDAIATTISNETVQFDVEFGIAELNERRIRLECENESKPCETHSALRHGRLRWRAIGRATFIPTLLESLIEFLINRPDCYRRPFFLTKVSPKVKHIP